jgi:pimeloyl-ACP methyl ester carboxylesterase
MSRFFSIFPLAVFSVGLAACGGDSNDLEFFDAGYEASTQPVVEAGMALEGGLALDAAQPVLDAAGASDSSTPASDAAASGDAKLPSADAGADAGVTQPSGKCSAKLPAIPDDVGVRGPWDVGVRTVKIDRLTVEVMYPAKPGSSAGAKEATYDVRDFLPPQEREKVPADHSPAVTALGGRVFRDVPIDDQFGPYPVVIFIHGTASFRIASGSTNAHWASRGFVVLAADYPGLGLRDQLSQTWECNLPTTGPQDIPKDVNAQLAALGNPSGDVAFLAGRLDLKQLAIAGHSQGGCVSSTLSKVPGVRVVMSLSGSAATDTSDSLESILYLSGMEDRVMPYNFGPWVGDVVCPLGSLTVEGGYAFSPGMPKVKKRLVGIAGGGHLVPTDLCQTNMQGKNAIQEAEENKVCGVGGAVIIGLPYLFDCGRLTDWKVGVTATNYATTAVLEETLHCKDRTQAFKDMKSKVPTIGDFRDGT